MIVALSGGVGGAKLVKGFYLTARPLAAIVNTADDFVHLGLHISPDLDSVMYALAELSDPERGWGVREESWNALRTLAVYGAPTWFQLGDRDLATHLLRTQWLREGKTLTQATEVLCRRLGIGAQVLPMCDPSVRTQVRTPDGWLDFQEYFVKARCEPEVREVRFLDVEHAAPTPQVDQALAQAELIVLCPSNPLVSLDPILSVPGMVAALQATAVPVVAVSPLIGGKAVKGPTVEMLIGLGIEPSPVAVAQRYANFLDGFVLDERDQALRPEVERLDLRVEVADTLMQTNEHKRRLAETIVDLWL